VGSQGGAGQEEWRRGSPRWSGDGGRWEAAGAAVFNGGGVALVVVNVRGGILQHRCGRGKRDLAPIWEWRSSAGAHRRGGRQRHCSAKFDMRKRPPVARGSGTSAEMVGREAALERGAGEELVMGEQTSGGSAIL
jgi:hypothetical protein